MKDELSLKLNNLSLVFNSRTLFKDISLDLGYNDSICLSSPSGKGKTSIFNCILGYINTFSGTIKVCGIDYNKNNINLIRKKIAWLPQNFNLHATMSVEEAFNLPFTFPANQKLKPERASLIEEMEKLELSSKMLTSSFSQISGGEKQRVGLIICKLLKRPLCILDEPTSALDKSSKEKVIDYILKSEKMAVLSASHDLDWLESCNSVLELNGGSDE